MKLRATKDRVEDITARGPILSRASETPYGQKVCLGRMWMKGKKRGARFEPHFSPAHVGPSLFMVEENVQNSAG
jgi:hypothetical protein